MSDTAVETVGDKIYGYHRPSDKDIEEARKKMGYYTWSPEDQKKHEEKDEATRVRHSTMTIRAVAEELGDNVESCYSDKPEWTDWNKDYRAFLEKVLGGPVKEATNEQ